MCLGGVINKKLSAYVSCMRSGVAWSGAKDLTRGGSHIACVFVLRPDGLTVLRSAPAWSSLASESCLLSLALPLPYFPALSSPYARRY